MVTAGPQKLHCLNLVASLLLKADTALRIIISAKRSTGRPPSPIRTSASLRWCPSVRVADVSRSGGHARGTSDRSRPGGAPSRTAPVLLNGSIACAKA